MIKPEKRIFVASALRGDIEANLRIAERLCKHVADLGHAPYAPHLLFTRFMDDDKDHERNYSIACGLMFLETCDELWAFGPLTPGMQLEVEFASAKDIPVLFKEIPDETRQSA